MRKFWSISLILMIITLTSCGEKLTDKQLFTKANELAGDERFEEAISNFQKIFEEFPESNYREKALFMMGFLYANHLKNHEKARIAYEKFLELYPKSEMVPSAKFELEHLGEEISDIEGLTKEAPDASLKKTSTTQETKK